MHIRDRSIEQHHLIETPAGENEPERSLALMLGGGGARGAYQAGVLRGLARLFPQLNFPIITGISAGAVNTIHLAAFEGNLAASTDALAALWMALTPEQVYDVRATHLLGNLVRWGTRLLSGGIRAGPEPMRGMVDTDPLRQFLGRSLVRRTDGSLPGIDQNIQRGTLQAVALSATSYTTGHSMTWVQGRDIALWQRPQRRSQSTPLTVEHVMASSALPMLFPAVRVGDQWFGDGGIRLTSPLSPALHLGATRILTISTKYRPPHGANGTTTHGYPPPAQVLGVLYNAIFLDQIDEDMILLGKVNRLLADLPSEKHQGMRIVGNMVIRPSKDLRRLVRELETRLPAPLRYLTRGLGTRQTRSPEFLSLILFEREYIGRLIELGEADAQAQAERFDRFLQQPVHA
ncbi:MAG TPA: patatin-like phospholipase family protein [Gemmatimonadaceae bacterium]|nr:patatin-like phospholipase family protein [Gemmatimonadaceae bacterium]